MQTFPMQRAHILESLVIAGYLAKFSAAGNAYRIALTKLGNDIAAELKNAARHLALSTDPQDGLVCFPPEVAEHSAWLQMERDLMRNKERLSFFDKRFIFHALLFWVTSLTQFHNSEAAPDDDCFALPVRESSTREVPSADRSFRMRSSLRQTAQAVSAFRS
jgi:hypothetical protein